ncbi:hypothetical protein BDN72DRAFT_35406 [Pluteus cervinus]|uniref:Uncharacterized protein n=1 Tax=Pluteus cervinus TaxID=181527 RepID=A0ACD3BI42_9AGAR|nr:hypothetical protein BDN72DRAFT_35406 [Pluteus cervinus]
MDEDTRISSVASSPLASLSPSPMRSPQRATFCYVSLPRLSAEERSRYKSVGDTSLKALNVQKFDEIIGEYQDGDKFYYFARYKEGIAWKFPARSFTLSHPQLVQKYKLRKAEGSLEEFNPSASYVHPLSRVKIKLKISKGRASSNPRDDSDFEDEESGEEEDESYGLETRSAKAGRSDRKLRSRFDTEDVESDGDSHGGHRRSTRATRLKRKASQRSDGADSDEYSNSVPTQKKQKRTYRKRTVKAEYGIIRSMDDLDDESGSDAEGALKRHREFCEKCHRSPANELVASFEKKSKKKGRKKKRDEFDENSEDERERLEELGGWVRCLRCPVSAHWHCLSGIQRVDILKAAQVKAPASGTPDAPPRRDLGIEESTEFFCGACTKGGICLGCLAAIEPPSSSEPVTSGDLETEAPSQDVTKPTFLLFRCATCKRPAHYEHMPNLADEEDSTAADIARYYQVETKWLCQDCSSYTHPLDKIIAWRPYPPSAIELPPAPGSPSPWKVSMPREYLVKWQERSYRRTQWVPHMWLVSTSSAKLKNFLTGGTKVELVDATPAPDDMLVDGVSDSAAQSRDTSRHPSQAPSPLDSMPDAERRIPAAWKTVDRVLDVLLWRPPRIKRKGRSSESPGVSDDEYEEQHQEIFQYGNEPSPEFTETISQYENRTDNEFVIEDIRRVVWAFIKWDRLGYDEATWDSPPRPDEAGYDAYEAALRRLLVSRQVSIVKMTKSHAEVFDHRPEEAFRKHVLKDAADLQLGQSPNLKLMPFQVDGFNWLASNWWAHQHCILADEMGLGKTVQIATFLGYIAAKFKASPALVVVPNSTITNWVRELEQWAPNLTVVPFYGEAKARDIIKRYELHHEHPSSGNTHAKFHVLVATYETLLNAKDFAPVFKNQPRWEVLIVDEGQRLKNDSSLLFKKLNELNSIHRIIMTGTPLNNNIRELFNLMNFLDPNEWKDLAALEKEHEELTEDLVKQLHLRLRPYFLRRVKAEVLQLPPKNEVIVPVSMTSLQKEVYRSILGKNLEILKGLIGSSRSRPTNNSKNVHNMLMQLRKCLQHPYLYDENIEPPGLSRQAAHEKLIDGSTKLRLLKMLLPKLKERGHRILLFSQFVIALDVIEDFLVGEGYRFLRLDGNTKSSERQKSMDEFNRPGSDTFIFLLTTRAGGVGINLYSADTVIIFDPDFNPHQDLQAIARAYRYGQKKTCLVFKLMVKDSAEERIMQIGKKKLVLDHLIVQKMDDEDTGGENLQSILTYGAKALFEELDASRDITYSEHDIEKLIEKTELEGDEAVDNPLPGAMTFNFAKVWSADKDALEEVGDVDPSDSWAQTLEKITQDRAKAQSEEMAQAGRGVRRKAAVVAQSNMRTTATSDGPAIMNVPQQRSGSVSGSSYSGSDASDSDGGDDMAVDEDPLEVPEAQRRRQSAFLQAPHPNGVIPQPSAIALGKKPKTYEEKENCGLCGVKNHSDSSTCAMVEPSHNLAEFREMLMLHADDEPWEQRFAAVRAIDETLYKRGDIALIAGQPLHLIRKKEPAPRPKPKSAPRPQAGTSSGSGHQSRPQQIQFRGNAF